MYMAHSVSDMTDQRRALLTDREREILAGEADVTDNYRYSVESRVRTRLKENLEADIEVIRTHYPEIFDELLYPLVCEPSAGDREEQTPEPAVGVYEEAVETEEPAEPGRAGREPAASGDDLRDRMEAELEELDVPGRPPAVEETRREAIKFAWERLREEGKMQPRDLANETFQEFEDDPDLGYSASGTRYDGYQLWDNCVRGVLRELPGVYPGSGSAGWKFRED